MVTAKRIYKDCKLFDMKKCKNFKNIDKYIVIKKKNYVIMCNKYT